ncbi:hypothetical protein CL634_09790 [bacterium]|nr:hypothetical protein [bacterium]|tara:strand:- start:3891 stop:4220 length:330 start_codon:yes stop_codon:yes gene_type:complete
MKKIINSVKSLVDITRFKKPPESLKRNLYAVAEGSFKGEFFVYINENDENMYFLSLPDNIIRKVPKKEFHSGVKENIIEFIEKIPGEIYEICIAQYNKSKTKEDLNRLK